MVNCIEGLFIDFVDVCDNLCDSFKTVDLTRVFQNCIVNPLQKLDFDAESIRNDLYRKSVFSYIRHKNSCTEVCDLNVVNIFSVIFYSLLYLIYEPIMWVYDILAFIPYLIALLIDTLRS